MRGIRYSRLAAWVVLSTGAGCGGTSTECNTMLRWSQGDLTVLGGGSCEDLTVAASGPSGTRTYQQDPGTNCHFTVWTVPGSVTLTVVRDGAPLGTLTREVESTGECRIPEDWSDTLPIASPSDAAGQAGQTGSQGAGILRSPELLNPSCNAGALPPRDACLQCIVDNCESQYAVGFGSNWASSTLIEDGVPCHSYRLCVQSCQCSDSYCHLSCAPLIDGVRCSAALEPAFACDKANCAGSC